MRASKLSALFLTTAMAFGMAGQAYAVQPGARMSYTQMEQALQQEHQTEFAQATYLLDRHDGTAPQVLRVKFTINDKGDAYILLSDGLDPSKAHIELVYAKLKNARVYDPSQTGTLPIGVSPDSKLASLIKRGVRFGDGVLIHGQIVVKDAAGKESVGNLVTVMVNESGRGDSTLKNTAGIFVTTPSGQTTLTHFVATNVIVLPSAPFTNPKASPAQGSPSP